MKNILCIILLFIGIKSSAQEFEKGVFRLKLKSENARPCNSKVNGKFADDDKINGIFKKYDVISYEQSYPFAKNPELLIFEYADENLTSYLFFFYCTDIY
jgi:hypothetical protein